MAAAPGAATGRGERIGDLLAREQSHPRGPRPGRVSVDDAVGEAGCPDDDHYVSRPVSVAPTAAAPASRQAIFLALARSFEEQLSRPTVDMLVYPLCV